MATAERLYQRALNLWGTDAQMRMLVEECAELTVAVCHGLRGRTNERSIDELCAEIADVQIMCEQVALMIHDGKVRVEAARQVKLDRLRGRVETAEQVRRN